MREFIPVQEARKLIAAHGSLLSAKKIALEDAGGLVLSSPARAVTDVPPFNQSSMDGYAINFAGWQEHKILELTGRSAAGLFHEFQIEPHQAARIFTGATVPKGADTVVMQEKTRIDGNKLIIEDSGLIAGSNFRRQGSEIQKDAVGLETGSILTPAALGFLAGMGIAEVSVQPAPDVAIILTGNELCPPGVRLQAGQVYESNSFALKSALQTLGIRNINVYSAVDELKKVSETLAMALEHHDMVLLTGGVSVGDYDFVIAAAEENKIEGIFHKVRQKPGKPLYFGKKESKLIFGLPGNPASVLSCFYQYVQPCIGQMMRRNKQLNAINANLRNGLRKPAGLTQFLKAFYDGETVSDLNAQESFRLSSFAMANCLMELEQEKTEYQAGETVTIHLLPTISDG